MCPTAGYEPRNYDIPILLKESPMEESMNLILEKSHGQGAIHMTTPLLVQLLMVVIVQLSLIKLGRLKTSAFSLYRKLGA